MRKIPTYILTDLLIFFINSRYTNLILNADNSVNHSY